MTGTSQATALVTGAAALLWAQRPDWQDPARVAQHLRDTVQFDATWIGQSRSQGRLNVLRTLAVQDRGRSFSGFHLKQARPKTRFGTWELRQD